MTTNVVAEATTRESFSDFGNVNCAADSSDARIVRTNMHSELEYEQRARGRESRDKAGVVDTIVSDAFGRCGVGIIVTDSPVAR